MDCCSKYIPVPIPPVPPGRGSKEFGATLPLPPKILYI